MAKQRGPGKPFLPGNDFGRGRPLGARNKARPETLLERESEAIIRKAIDLAKAGDITALRLCVERLVPPRKQVPLRLTLPSDISTVEGTRGALSALLTSVAHGEITTNEILALVKILETYLKVINTEEFARRLSALEEKVPDAA